MGHGIAFGGRGDLDGVAFVSPELLRPPEPVSSSEAVAWSSRREGRLIALPRGLDLLWCDPSVGSPVSKRTILGTDLGPSEDGPSGSASTCPAGEAELSADKPRAVCVLTCRVRRPVDLVGVPRRDLFPFTWGLLLALAMTCPLVIPPLAGPPLRRP